MIFNTKNQLKLEIIHKVESKKISHDEARLILNISERTLQRYLKNYREKGVLFLRHGNRDKAPINRLPQELKTQVQALVRDIYFDLNMLHCLEKLKSDHGIYLKRETFRKWCHEIGCVKRKRKRRSRPRYHRTRMAQAGLMIQMDGSLHRWFGNTPSCLIATIDDATSEVPYAEFFDSESTISCMKVLKNLIEKKGIFSILYVDRAGVYGGIKRSGFSQLQRALEELGTQVIYAQSPEAKGRIERLFLTLQDRLIPEMRLKEIRSLSQANQYLQQVFLPTQYNLKYKVAAENPVSAYKACPIEKKLHEIFCIKEYRTVARDHTLSLDSERYRIDHFLQNSIYRQKIEIRTYLDGSWQAFFAGKKIHLTKIKIKKTAA